MRRLILEQLSKWKQKEKRKPLLIYGARQVGKNWVMEEFGKTQFKDFVHLNVERNEKICAREAWRFITKNILRKFA